MSTSNFPLQIDEIKRVQDFPQSQAANIKRYDELRKKSTLTSDEQMELADLRIIIDAYKINADDWNLVADAIETGQEFFKDNVDGYVQGKQVEIATYAEDKKSEFDVVLNQFSNKGLWSNLTTYQKWNTVSYNYETYMSLKNGNLNNIPVGDGTDVWWQKMAMRGSQGSPGMGLSWAGEYDNARSYVAGNAVRYENDVYYCVNPSTGNLPIDTDYWDTFLTNSGIAVQSVAPSEPYLNMCWIDTSTTYNNFKYWNGTTWNIVGVSANKVSISDTGNIITAENVEDALQEIVKNPSNVTKMPTATGTGTAIIIATDKSNFILANGYSVTFVASANNNSAVTTINIDGKGAKNVYKPGTTTAPNFVAGKAYTVWYNLSNNCFFTKASAEGTAVAENVLAGKTFSNDDDIGIEGTIPSKTAQTYTPSQSTQTISSGQYLSGNQTISAVSFDASKVLNDTTIAGKKGTMPNNPSQTATLSITSSAKPTKTVPAGYSPGGTITAEVTSSKAGIIKKGETLGGAIGTFIGDTPAKVDVTNISLSKSFSSPASEVNEVGTIHTITGGAKIFMFQSNGDSVTFPNNPLPYTYGYQKCTSSSSSLSGARLYLEDSSGKKIDLVYAWYGATEMNQEDYDYLFTKTIIFCDNGNGAGMSLTYDPSYGIYGYNSITVGSTSFDYHNTFYLKYHCYCTATSNTIAKLYVRGKIIYF